VKQHEDNPLEIVQGWIDKPLLAALIVFLVWFLQCKDFDYTGCPMSQWKKKRWDDIYLVE